MPLQGAQAALVQADGALCCCRGGRGGGAWRKRQRGCGQHADERSNSCERVARTGGRASTSRERKVRRGEGAGRAREGGGGERTRDIEAGCGKLSGVPPCKQPVGSLRPSLQPANTRKFAHIVTCMTISFAGAHVCPSFIGMHVHVRPRPRPRSRSPASLSAQHIMPPLGFTRLKRVLLANCGSAARSKLHASGRTAYIVRV